MDPATATLLTTIGTTVLSSIFGPSQPQGPTQAQILAALERKRQEDAATRQAWLIGGGLVGVGLIAFLLISRK